MKRGGMIEYYILDSESPKLYFSISPFRQKIRCALRNLTNLTKNFNNEQGAPHFYAQL